MDIRLGGFLQGNAHVLTPTVKETPNLTIAEFEN